MKLTERIRAFAGADTAASAAAERPAAASSETPRTVLRGVNSHAVCVDWMRFSGSRSLLGEVVAKLSKLLGAGEPAKARFNKESCIRWGDTASVHWNAEPSKSDRDTSLLVEITGTACAMLEPDDVHAWLRWFYSHGFRPTRLDLAVDFFGEQIDLIDRMRQASDAGCLCGARVYGHQINREASGALRGHMITTGRRGKNGSGRYLRCYDKGLEQESRPAGEWIRLEGEFSDEVAFEALELLCDQEDLLAAAAEIVVGCVDFREANGQTSYARRPRLEWWDAVCRFFGSVRIKAPKRVAKLTGWLRWIGEAVVPGVATAAALLGQSASATLAELAEEFKPRADKLRSDVFVQFCKVLGVEWHEAERRVLAASGGVPV